MMWPQLRHVHGRAAAAFGRAGCRTSCPLPSSASLQALWLLLCIYLLLFVTAAVAVVVAVALGNWISSASD